MPITVASLEAILSLSKDKFESGLKSARGGLGDLGGKVATAAGAGIASGIAVGTAAIAGVSVAAFNVANELDTATASMAASLGISKDAAGEFRDEMKDIFAAGFGENFEEIGGALALVKKSIDGIDDQSLKAVAQGALAIEDNFDKDLNETTDAAAVLMKEFGLSGEQALDFISKGLQEGLDRNGDFIDSVREYGNLFGQAGADAGQFFSLLETGAAGGVLGTDKAADAFKEFQIRFLEGGSAAQDALSQLGFEYDTLTGAISDGNLSVADTFDQVIEQISAIEDPVEKSRLAVALLGTQAEDLGADAVAGIDLFKTSTDDLAGATDGLNQKYDTLGAALEGVKRKALVALEPLGKGMLDALNEVMPKVVAFFDDVIGPAIERFGAGAVPIFTDFVDKLTNTVGPAMDLINDALKRINIALGGTGENTDIVNVALGALKGILDAVIIGIQATALVFQGVAWAIEQVSLGVKTVIGWFDTLGSKLGELDIPDWLKPGSPPPLANALSDISAQLKAMPDLAGAFNVGATGANVPAAQTITSQGAQTVNGGGSGVTVVIQGNIYGDSHLEEIISENFSQLTMALSGA